MTQTDQEKTHFGFETIDAASKARRVGEVFSSVARRYDLMNDVMSLGIHHVWKNRMLEILSPTPGRHLLDVAGGTGDIAFRFQKQTGGKVTICDINNAMLEEGKRRSIDANCWQGLEWVCGDAEHLPFPDQSFDYYTIAFGIRNVTHIDAALREAHRVLKPGGKFACLEFSKVTNPALAKIYDLYSFKIIPHLGKLIAGDSASYQYLVESIRQFPAQEQFAAMIKEAGFSQVQYKNLSSGVVAVHWGWRV